MKITHEQLNSNNRKIKLGWFKCIKEYRKVIVRKCNFMEQQAGYVTSSFV